jgi:small subunit ribosomal protein S20
VSASRSVQKATRVAARRRQQNRALRTRVKTATKKTRKTIDAGDLERARQELIAATSTIDRAANRGIFHKNKAARMKSRLTRKVSALGSGR